LSVALETVCRFSLGDFGAPPIELYFRSEVAVNHRVAGLGKVAERHTGQGPVHDPLPGGRGNGGIEGLALVERAAELQVAEDALVLVVVRRADPDRGA